MERNRERTRAPRAFAAVIALAVGAIASCDGGSSNTGDAGAESGTPGDLTTAWEKIVAATPKDGVWTLEQTKQAFSLTVAQLPNVTVPTGADPAKAEAAGHDSGALAACHAIRLMHAYWNELTFEEQAITAQALAEDTSTNGSLQPKDAPIKFGSGLAPRDEPAKLTPEQLEARRKEVLQKFNEEVALISAKLGIALSPTIALTVAEFVGKPGVRAHTIPLTANEAKMAKPLIEADPGPVATCRVKIAPRIIASDGGLRHTLAHEAFHCFQAQVMGLKAWRNKAFLAWSAEGTANWVAYEVVGRVPDLDVYWIGWFTEPNHDLFARAYTAQGFFSEVNYLGNPVWPLMSTFLTAKTNSDSFKIMIDPVNAVLKRSWAASMTREKARGSEWTTAGSGVPDEIEALKVTRTIDEGGSAVFVIDPRGADVFEIAGSAEILALNLEGGGIRLADSAGLDTYAPEIGAAVLCAVDDCRCPDGTPLPIDVVKVKPVLTLAFTGWDTGSGGEIKGYSRKTFCSNYDPTKNFCKVVAPMAQTSADLITYAKGHPTEFQATWTKHVKLVKDGNKVAPKEIATSWGRIVQLYDTYTTPFYAAMAWDASNQLDPLNRPVVEQYTSDSKPYRGDLQAGGAYLQSKCGIAMTP